VPSSGPAGQRKGAAQRRPAHPRAREQRWEMAVGIVGVFTLIALINTIVLEVRGEEALFAALVLLVFVLLFAFVLNKRWGLFSRR
jgi:hypothetical protein